MNRRFAFVLIIGWVLLSAFSVGAQSGTQVVDLGEDYQIVVPDDWTIQEESDGSLSLLGFGWGVFPYQPDLLDTLVDISVNMNAVEVLQESFSLFFFDRPPATRDIETLEIDGRDAALYLTEADIDGETYDYWLYAVELSDKQWAVILIAGEQGLLDEVSDEVEEVVISFDRASRSGVGGLRQDGSSGGSGGGEACTVGVDTRDTARLRVGPGENRTAIAFLPIGDGYTVTGRFVDDNGGVWYQLDKDEAAPQSAASEIWVSAGEVDETGDCENVGDTSAPPIVPIVPGAPPAGGGGEPPPPGPVTGVVPLGGFYRITFLSAMIDASCQGTGNIQFPVEEAYEGSASGFITVLDGGARLNYEGDIWTRAADGSGFYSGNLTFAPGSPIPNGIVYLNVISATELRGTLVSNFTIDGVPCSDTVAISVRRG